MPAAAIVVPAVAALAGAYVQSRSQNKATAAQAKANADAMAYEKETQANRQSRYDAAYQDYRKRYDEWLGRYFPGSGTPAASPGGGSDVRAMSGGGGAAPPAPAPGYGTPGAGQGSSRIAQLMLGQGAQQAEAAQNSGQFWGSTLSGIGQVAGQGIQNLPARGAPVSTMPPVLGSVPAPDDTVGWNDWRQYIRR